VLPVCSWRTTTGESACSSWTLPSPALASFLQSHTHRQRRVLLLAERRVHITEIRKVQQSYSVRVELTTVVERCSFTDRPRTELRACNGIAGSVSYRERDRQRRGGRLYAGRPIVFGSRIKYPRTQTNTRDTHLIAAALDATCSKLFCRRPTATESAGDKRAAGGGGGGGGVQGTTT